MAGAQLIETYISLCYNMENPKLDQTTYRSALAKPLGKASHTAKANHANIGTFVPSFQNNGNRPTGRDPTMAGAHTLRQGNNPTTQEQSFLFSRIMETGQSAAIPKWLVRTTSPRAPHAPHRNNRSLFSRIMEAGQSAATPKWLVRTRSGIYSHRTI